MPEKLIAAAIKTLHPKAPQDLKSFIPRFLSEVPRDDLAQMTASEIASLSETHYALSKSRKSGASAISIQNMTDTNREGWEARATLIDIVTPDRAFLIDSVAAYLASKSYVIDFLIHPRIELDKSERISHMHIRLRGVMTLDAMAVIRTDILGILKDIEDSTCNWMEMKDKVVRAQEYLLTAPKTYAADEVREWIDFLNYIGADNFTFLGYREYRFITEGKKIRSEIVRGSGLGLLSDQKKPAYINEDALPLPDDLQRLRASLPPLAVGKINRISTVHRRVPLDAITVKRYDEKGHTIGEILFMGLFTSVTYSRSLRGIPFLRYKADQVIKRSGFETASHNGRALRHILEKYPRDELFQINLEDLEKTCLSILRLQERQRIALYMRHDPFGRYVSCLVYVPRDRFETRLRLAFQTILEKSLQGVCKNYYSTVDDSPLVRVLYIISVPQGQKPTLTDAQIEYKLQQAGRVWGDTLSEALHDKLPNDEESLRLAAKYATAFSSDYRKITQAKHAVKDILKLEQVSSTKQMALDFFSVPIDPAGTYHLKIFHPGSLVPLSDILPILENMGVRVLSEQPFEVQPDPTQPPIWIQDFTLQVDATTAIIDVAKIKPLFEEALTGIWAGTYENDKLNSLTLHAGIPPRSVMALRGYVRYVRLTSLPYGIQYIEQAVTDHPAIARHLIDLFTARFDTTHHSKNRAKDLEEKILQQLESVASLDQDRILRALLSLILNTLRTNAYQNNADGTLKSYISYKLAANQLTIIPNPKPYREIFVYARHTEGVHLRGDKIARGGLRWSDRHEDFRTEILGLLKAQTVKNAVIVPMGAKGGFIVKTPPKGEDRAALQAEGIRCYQTFIRGLLDITDNYKLGQVVPPSQTIRHDGDDPYLVVAADKGTATFSDIANALSLEYGFWMGDAFASGGSAGYDHKKMGITARGAWESVKRHFRELNHDTQAKPFDVIGVGDMGGDVFGNGMLQSPHIRLIGAFNHVHIFCDPDPDPATSFAERKRLFDAVGGWDQYDLKKLSKGGQIFKRSEKVLTLTPEIMKRLDITDEKVSPNDLIQALLKARTNLLFFGGIGTYVKATSETHSDAGDKGNDALRVNATELRAKVVGEGANLGMTHRARIECASRGIKLNTDFIDNSAGVDTSDHEVNIKILFYQIMAQKNRLTLAQRNTFLKKMTDEIAALVLADNYQQTQALSLIELRGAERLPVHIQLIEALEREAGLDRKLEALPSAAELAERAKRGQGLYRPELCTLLSYAKILLTRYILNSDLPDDPLQQDWLTRYFPKPMQKDYAADLKKHPLKREIIATGIANMILNRMGIGFILQARSRIDGDSILATRAFLAVYRMLDLETSWQHIEKLDGKASAAVQYKAFRALARFSEMLTFWLIKEHPHLITDTAGQNRFGAALTVLQTHIAGLMAGDAKRDQAQLYQAWINEGLPKDLAEKLSVLSALEQILDLATAPLSTPDQRVALLNAYLHVGDASGIDWLRGQLRYLKLDGVNGIQLQETMLRDLSSIQKNFAQKMLSARTNHPPVAESFQSVHALKAQGQIDLAGVLVTLHGLKENFVRQAVAAVPDKLPIRKEAKSKRANPAKSLKAKSKKR